MEKTYFILTSLLMVSFAVYIAFSFALLRYNCNSRNLLKCLGISSITLVLVSIPRTIVMMQLEKDYIVFFWVLTAYWLFQSMLSIFTLIKE